jgi:hypothetical protein
MTYLNPGTLVASEQGAKAVFEGTLLPAFTPLLNEMPFFVTLEAAMRAGWATLSTPVALSPPVVAIVPTPVVFAPSCVGIYPAGINSLSNLPSRMLLANIIHAWTITHQTIAINPAGTMGPIL